MEENINIQVKFVGPFRSVSNMGSVNLKISHNANVNALLDILREMYREPMVDLLKNLDNTELTCKLIYINNRPLYALDGLNTEVKGGDKVSFLPPMNGG